MLPARSMSRPEQMRPARRRRLIWRAFRILFGVYIVGAALVWTLQSRLLFPRGAAGPALATLDRREGEAIWLKCDDGVAVEAWFLPGVGRTSRSPGPAVIYLHGNGEIIEQCLGQARLYTQRGISVLLPEYRGYGRSGGSPSETTIGADMVEFYDRLLQRAEVDRSQVILHGRSVGGGVAAHLALQRPPAALVLESTFTSVASFAWRFGLPPALCTNPFHTDRVVPILDRPILILHGADDEQIPPEHGRRLHALAPGSVYAELSGGHNDFPRDQDGYERAIFGFLRDHRLDEPHR